MCGGHGVYHLLDQLVNGMPGEQRSQPLSIARPDSSPAAMAREVKLMYARGEIDADVFHRMLGMAHSGQLDWDIVDGVHVGRRLVSQPAETLPQGSRESSPEFLERQRQLQEAHAETAQALQRLETDLFRLHAQAANAGAKTQLAEADSEQARAHLETKQGALFRAGPLEERISSLRDSLQRIEMQLKELEEREPYYL